MAKSRNAPATPGGGRLAASSADAHRARGASLRGVSLREMRRTEPGRETRPSLGRLSGYWLPPGPVLPAPLVAAALVDV